MVVVSGNTPEVAPERGIKMAIAIDNFPVAALGRRNMAPVYRRRRAVVSLVLAALAVTVSFAMLDTSAAADRPTAENLATPKFVSPSRATHFGQSHNVLPQIATSPKWLTS